MDCIATKVYRVYNLIWKGRIMDDKRNQTLTSLHVDSVVRELEPAMKAELTALTGHALGHIETHRGRLEELLPETGQMLRRRVSEFVISPKIIGRVVPEWDRMPESEQEHYIHRLSYYLRRVAPEVSIPAPRSIIRPAFAGWALGGSIGAFIGVAMAQMLSGNPEYIVVLTRILSPLGALGGLLSVRWIVSRHPFLAKWGTRSGDRLDTDQLRINIRATIATHLRTQLTLLILGAALIPTDGSSDVPAPERLPENLLSALAKLAGAPEETRGAISTEVIQEYHNAGYSKVPAAATITWSDALREQYDTLGVVEPGDTCRILKAPVMQDSEIRRKGRVMRCR